MGREDRGACVDRVADSGRSSFGCLCFRRPAKYDAHMSTGAIPVTDSAIEYAPLGRRVGAICIDLFVLGLILGAPERLSGFCASLAWIFPLSLRPVLMVAYFIVCHGQFGQTLGKHLMGIKVVRLSGEPVGWPRACLRGSVDLFLCALELVGVLVALLAMPEGDSIEGSDGAAALDAVDLYPPTWQSWILAASLAWLALQAIAVLSNRPRRALHDFIAGTVVVKAPRSRLGRRDIVPPALSHGPG